MTNEAGWNRLDNREALTLQSPGSRSAPWALGLRAFGAEERDGDRQRRAGFKRKDLFVVLAIIAVGLILLLPGIQSAREAGRRATCLCHGKQFGLSMQNYASTHSSEFPPSAEVFIDPAGHRTVGGYSVFVKILPFMGYDALYKSLPTTIPNGDIDAAMSGDATLAKAMNTPLPDAICPSNPNKAFKYPNENPPQFAFTNFKAVGASTRNSLLMAADPTAKPPYGGGKMHPDGALYPSDKDLPMADLKDGTSHTIVAMETMDDTSSRWMVGTECILVGLPQASSPTGKAPAPPYPFLAPTGFDNTFGDGSAVARAGLRTFLSYDFSPKGADVGKYEDPGWAKAPPAYGPSSAHLAVVIVAFADGSVTALSKQVDAANLFFLITKANNDPFYLP